MSNHVSFRSIVLTLLTPCGLSMLACDVEQYDEQDLIFADEEVFYNEDDLLLIEEEIDGTTRSINVTLTSPPRPSAAPWYDTVQQGQWRHLSFQKLEGVYYKICITPEGNTNPDLYGYWAGYPEEEGYYHKKSTKAAGYQDCIDFTATKTEWYYLSIYGKTWSKYKGEFLW